MRERIKICQQLSRALAAAIPLLSGALAWSAPPAGAPQRADGARITLSWHGQELGAALDRLRRDQQLPLWVDRRIDASAPVDFDVADRPLLDALNLLAGRYGASAINFQGVLYFGPSAAAAELPVLAERARASLDEAPAERRRQWLAAAPWSFPRLGEPRGLIEQIAQSAGASVDHADRVPHDLWPARTLPRASPLDVAVLVLAGFDLTCDISADGRRLAVVPIQRPLMLKRAYAVPDGRRRAVEAVLAETATAESRWDGRRLSLSGPAEVHQRVGAALSSRKSQVDAAPRAAGDAATSRRFTLKIENRPVEQVLSQLAQQLQLQIAWSSDVQPSDRRAMTTCDVRQADLDGLLSAILAPADLSFERTGQEVRIWRSSSK